MPTCKLLRPFTCVSCTKCHSTVLMFYVSGIYVCNDCLYTVPYIKCQNTMVDIKKFICHIQHNMDDVRRCNRLVQTYLRWNGLGDTTVYDMRIVNGIRMVMGEVTDYGAYSLAHELVKVIHSFNPYLF